MKNWIQYLFALLLATPVWADTLSTSQGTLRITPMITGLDVPWAIGFAPDGAAFVTDREGRLIHWTQERTQEIKGLPKTVDEGQGGLLDVMVPRDFAQSREIFLTYSIRQGRGSGTALARALLAPGASRLSDLKVLFQSAPHSLTNRHYGSRVVEARDGTLYLSIGDRGERPSAQNLGLHQGSIIRLNRDGSVPTDNPFVGRSDARPEIWSYGHRNPQGMALDPQGRIWTAEHGARGGDEINLIRRGANFGWPVISYGRHYSGGKIGEGTAKKGMEQPEFYWDPSIAPSGMMIYSGKLWPSWQGQKFVGSLKFDYIARLSGTPLREREKIQSDLTGRIRAVAEAPDGTIWFASEIEGTVYRISP